MDASKLNKQIVTCIAIKEALILEIARGLVTSTLKILFLARLIHAWDLLVHFVIICFNYVDLYILIFYLDYS